MSNYFDLITKFGAIPLNCEFFYGGERYVKITETRAENPTYPSVSFSPNVDVFMRYHIIKGEPKKEQTTVDPGYKLRALAIKIALSDRPNTPNVDLVGYATEIYNFLKGTPN